jgi:hypothetical protein
VGTSLQRQHKGPFSFQLVHGWLVPLTVLPATHDWWKKAECEQRLGQATYHVAGAKLKSCQMLKVQGLGDDGYCLQPPITTVHPNKGL